MGKYVFIVLCALAAIYIALAVVGWWKNKPLAKLVTLGITGGTFAGLAYILHNIPWK